MHLRQPFVRDLELHAARRVGLDQIHVLPGDHARRDLLEQRTKRERRDDAFGEAPDGAASADVDREQGERHVIVDGRRVELDVVHPDDFAAMDVDDLLIEEVALEQQHAVGHVVGLPARGVARGSNRRAARPDGLRTQHALADWRAHDEKRDARWMILGRDRDLAHASPRGAAVIADRCAEKFRQSDDGHDWTIRLKADPTRRKRIARLARRGRGGANASPLVQASAPRSVRVCEP